MGIIRECGGKMHMSEGKLARDDFVAGCRTDELA